MNDINELKAKWEAAREAWRVASEAHRVAFDNMADAIRREREAWEEYMRAIEEDES